MGRCPRTRMTRPTLLMAAVVAWLVAGVYAYIGRNLVTRHTTHDVMRRALWAFASWWWLLALNIAIAGGIYFAAGLGYTSFPVQVTWAHVERLLLAASLFGLMYYMIYVLWGRIEPVAIGAFYTIFYGLLVYELAREVPYDVHIGQWRTDLLYQESDVSPLGVIAGLMLLVPVIGACIAGLVIAGRGRGTLEPIHRYRLSTVSGALLVWWIVAVVAGGSEAQGHESFQLVNRFFGLLVALIILAAYRPPTWVLARLGHAPAKS